MQGRAVDVCGHPVILHWGWPLLDGATDPQNHSDSTSLYIISLSSLPVRSSELGCEHTGDRQAHKCSHRAHRHKYTHGHTYRQRGRLTFRASGSAKQTWAPHWMPVHRS